MAKKASTKPAATAAETATPTAEGTAPAPVVDNTAAPVAAPVVAVPEKVKEPESNGITRPSAGTTTRKVWEIADSLSTAATATESGQPVPAKPAQRKSVIEACTAQGINASTATTQFGKWAKFHGYTGEASPGRAEKPAPTAAPAAAAAPAPVAAPVAAPVPFDEGYDAAQRTIGGATDVYNPYPETSAEHTGFVNGWNKAYADNASASAPTETVQA